MVGGVYAAAAGLLIVAVLAVAYGSAAPSLAVAEFAPAANKALEAPPTTVGNEAAGGVGGGRRSTTTTAPLASASTADPAAGGSSAATSLAARTRACVGSPPRQTEDPMSPACMAAIFEGDNGGATGQGVSGTEIRVALSNSSGSATSAQTKVIDALFAYFNQRFELYGRRLVPVHVSGAGSTPLSARTHAAEIASRNVFATVTGMHEWNWEINSTLVATLAQSGVITVARAASSWVTDRVVYDQLHPYAWSVYPSSEDFQQNLADLSCRSLAGQLARFSTDPSIKQTNRKIAVLAGASQQAAAVRTLTDALADCMGSQPPKAEWTSASGASMRTVLQKFADAGATTIICVCDSPGQTTGVTTAQSMGFKPEWILTPTAWASGNDEYLVQSQYEASASFVPPMRLEPGPRILPLQSRPWYEALASTGLLTSSSTVYGAMGAAEFLYPELLMLATGIQGAGPTLTAETFGQALMSTQFPNPGAGAAPYYQPSAGFGPGDHSLYDDYALGWWSSSTTALDPVSPRPNGSWCFVGQGTRFQVGRYPTGDAELFNASVACR